ncbi:unnamed protein product [Symbiodinium microadriaticum]|nr:unnamed protein product [Symbiodinium microadriaticum]
MAEETENPPRKGRNKFMVVVDQTPECEIALYYASRRAANTGGGVTLLHVIEPADFQHWLSVEQAMKDEAYDEADQLLKGLAAQVQQNADLIAECVIREGKTREQVLKQIEEDPDIRILVLGADTSKDGPGPLVSSIAGGGAAASLRVPVTVERELLGLPFTGPIPGYEANRFFTKIPNPFLGGLLIFAAIMGPMLLVYWLTGYFDTGMLEAAGWRPSVLGYIQHQWYELLQSAIIAYVVVGGEWLRRGMARDIATLAPRLGLTDQAKLAETIKTLTVAPSPWRFVLAAGLALLLVPIMALPLMDAIPHDGFIAVLWVRLSIMIFAISLTVINYVIFLIRYVRLIDEKAVLRLPDLSGFDAVGQTGLRGAGFLFFGTAAAMPFLMDDRTMEVTAILLIILFILSIIALAGPLAGLRGRIRCDKILLMARLDQEIADLADQTGMGRGTNRAETSPAGDRLSQLIAYRTVIDESREWIINMDTGIRFVEGVSGVFLGSDFITVTKSDAEGLDWHHLKPAILAAIMDHFTAGRPVMADGASGFDQAAHDDELGPPTTVEDYEGADREVVEQIMDLLDTRVRPAVANDGGDILFHSFKDGTVFLHMQGACAGCPASTMTLKQGIENMMRHYIPDVEAVEPAALDQLFNEAHTFTYWQDTPVEDDVLQALYDLMKMGPTSANCSPARIVFVKSDEAKARLIPHLMDTNKAKTEKAPVCAIIANDAKFYDHMEWLYPQNGSFFKDLWSGVEPLAQETAMRNGSLQGGYFIMAARALGLDCGPMSGFDPNGVNDAFFAGTTWQANFLCNLGYGNKDKTPARNPRFDFGDAAACSVGLARDGDLLAGGHQLQARGHAEALVPMVQKVLANAGARFADLDRIAVTTGPGTFAGQRVALATARGMALAHDTEVIGLTTLEALALYADQPGRLFCAFDARREEVYGQSFEAAPDGWPLPLDDPACLPLTDATELAAKADQIYGSAGPVLNQPVSEDHFWPDARLIATRAHLLAPGPDRLPRPLYLRASDAEALARIHQAAFSARGERGWRKDELKDLLQKSSSRCFSLYENDTLVGFGLWQVIGDEAELLTIAIHPDHQGRGHGTQLLNRAPEAAILLLEVAADNAPAIALYRRAGFEDVGQRKAYYNRADGNKADAILMRRDARV